MPYTGFTMVFRIALACFTIFGAVVCSDPSRQVESPKVLEYSRHVDLRNNLGNIRNGGAGRTQTMAISSNLFVVGVPNANGPTSGAVYVYERATGDEDWKLQNTLTDPTETPESNHQFGWSVGILRGKILVGMHNSRRYTEVGLLLFSRTGSEWIVTQNITPFPDTFAFNDTTMIARRPSPRVGRDVEGHNRTVEVYSISEAGEIELTSSHMVNKNYNSDFGETLLVQGNNLYVGAPKDAKETGKGFTGLIYIMRVLPEAMSSEYGTIAGGMNMFLGRQIDCDERHLVASMPGRDDLIVYSIDSRAVLIRDEYALSNQIRVSLPSNFTYYPYSWYPRDFAIDDGTVVFVASSQFGDLFASLFEFDGVRWRSSATILGPFEKTSNVSDISVHAAISSDTIAVGFEHSEGGAVYLFDRSEKLPHPSAPSPSRRSAGGGTLYHRILWFLPSLCASAFFLVLRARRNSTVHSPPSLDKSPTLHAPVATDELVHMATATSLGRV